MYGLKKAIEAYLQKELDKPKNKQQSAYLMAHHILNMMKDTAAQHFACQMMKLFNEELASEDHEHH